MFDHRRRASLAIAVFGVANCPGAAWAHPGHGGGFQDGWQHPVTGIDHLLAMVAVGLLAARIGGRAVWVLPAVFLSAMLLGGTAAQAGWGLPGVETGIVLSVVVLGGLVFSAAVAPAWIAASIVAAFAFFHGHAHGAEMADGASLAPYAAGFLLATAFLHAAGVLGASGLARLRQQRLARLAGGVIAACGMLMLIRWM